MHLHNARVAASGCHMQRGLGIQVGHIGIGSARQQRVADRHMPRSSSLMQRRVSPQINCAPTNIMASSAI